MKVNYLLYLLVFFMLACDDEIADPEPGASPEADFIFQIQTNDPRSVSFASTSSGANSVIWDFGDGTRSTREAETKTYLENGTYTVALTAVNIAGINTVTREIVIDGPDLPEANFDLNFDGVASLLQVNFTNTSMFGDEIRWDFGDGNSSTDPELTSHTYAAPGTYRIRLEVIGNDERLTDQNRVSRVDREVTVIDERSLRGMTSKTWIFKEDSVVRNLRFTIDGETESLDTLISAYHVTRADTLFFEVLLEEDCMLDDQYTFSASGEYLNQNNGDGRLVEFNGQCRPVSEPGQTRWQIDRNEDDEFILVLVNSYLGDPEVGIFYKIIALTDDLLLVEVEVEAPISGDVRTVGMAFEPL